MKITELNQDSTVRAWLDNLKPKVNTKLAYVQAVSAYTENTCLTPKELIAEADKEESDQIRMRDRKIKGRLIGFRSYMIDRGLADFTIKGRMAGVRSFYQSFDIELPKLQGERRRARTKEENRGIPTKEDLQTVLKVCEPLEKAVVLTGISSGLSSVEIQNLTLSQFKSGYDPVTGITTLKLQRTKTGVEFITFLSPEASTAILEYIDYRNRESKAATTHRMKQLLKQRTFSDQGYLFILRQIDESYLQNHDEETRKLSHIAVQKMFRSISTKAKQNTGKGLYNIVRSHNMRKYFNSALLNAGCDSFHVEFFMGHELDNTRAAYFRAQPEKLKEIYKKYIPYLTIQKENSIADAPEFKSMTEEIQTLKGENEKLRLDRFENEAIRKLKEEIEELKRDKSDREALRKEFSQVLEEDKNYWEEIDKIIKSIAEDTGMTPATVYENFRFDVPAGETLRDHLKRMHGDPEYRNKFKKAITTSDLEKRENEMGRRAIKTLAEEL